MKHALMTCLILLPGACAAEKLLFDDGWKFIQQDIPGAEQKDYPDANWRVLNLPHDWSIEGKFDRNHPSSDRGGYLPTGVGWYRKTVDIPQAWRGKQIAIAFDGVFRNSTVWANGKQLGERPYGWISFEYDISSIVQASDKITFAVRVDNKLQHAARWYTGSGIYGHTWIHVREPIHIPTSGVWIRSSNSALSIDTEVANKSETAADCTVRTTILDADDTPVASNHTKISLTQHTSDIVAAVLDIPNARRWSPESPYLYLVVSEVLVDSRAVDRVETTFGLRDVQWKPGTGMWLNGKNVKLRGVCQHQHGGALGAAVNEKFIRFRVEQLKSMGCNAIRTAHNPHTPEFYDICDEVGMIVMDEFVDGWSKKARHDYGAHDFANWWRQDLTDWIKRDRNHPSIFLWSVGNETHGDVAKEMVARCHELDPTRPVTSGSSGTEYMDIIGMNGGSEVEGWFDKLPNDRVFIGTENTHTWQTRGYYRTQTWYRDGRGPGITEIPDLTEEEIFGIDWIDNARRSNRKQFFKSSYDNATVRSPARRAIAQIRDIPNNAGMFRWTGHDYLGEAGLASGGWPFKLFSGGAIDLANFEKDLYYLYQSQWTDDPMLHILPHWTHPMLQPGVEIPIWVYSNCDEVELFLNGKSLGKKSPGTKWQEMQCDWMVGWTPGKIAAVGYRDGEKVVGQTIRTADEPARIQLSVDGSSLAMSGRDFVQVRTSLVDAKGEFYPYGENRVWFDLLGPATIRALDNGNPVDVEPFFGVTARNAFFGLARAYVESTGAEGDIALVAGAILGDKRLRIANKVHIDVRQIALRGEPRDISPEVFYTIDETTPTIESTPYTGSFEVSLGTTVKAVVVLNGKQTLMMEERFANDVGLLWEGGGLEVDFGGEQAEDADYVGPKAASLGKNFNGTGYLDMGKKSGSYVEWYKENDGGAAVVKLTIRYSGVAADGRPLELLLQANDQASTELHLPTTVNWGSQWRTVTTQVTLKPGANTIRLTTTGDRGPFIDEIRFE